MRYLFLLIILYLCFNFVTLGQEVNIEFEKKPYWVENFDKKGGLDDKLWGSKKEKSGGLVFYTGADEKNVKVKKGKLILTIVLLVNIYIHLVEFLQNNIFVMVNLK